MFPVGVLEREREGEGGREGGGGRGREGGGGRGREGGREGEGGGGRERASLSHTYSRPPPPIAYLSTSTPADVAAFRSMLSTPVPARPISLSLLPAAMTSAVTLVAERTIKPS